MFRELSSNWCGRNFNLCRVVPLILTGPCSSRTPPLPTTPSLRMVVLVVPLSRGQYHRELAGCYQNEASRAPRVLRVGGWLRAVACSSPTRRPCRLTGHQFSDRGTRPGSRKFQLFRVHRVSLTRWAQFTRATALPAASSHRVTASCPGATTCACTCCACTD